MSYLLSYSIPGNVIIDIEYDIIDYEKECFEYDVIFGGFMKPHVEILKGFEYYLKYKGSIQSDKTIEQYVGHAKQYIIWLENSFGEPFVKLHRVNIIDYRSYERQRNDNGTFNRKHTSLKVFNEYLIEEKIQDDMVVRNMDRLPEERRVTSPTKATVEDYKVMAHKIRNSTGYNAVRDAVIVWSIVGTGIRVSECCNLHINEVHFNSGEGGWFYIRRGKGGPPRKARFGQSVRVELETYLEKRNELYPSAADDPHLFVTRKSNKDGSYRMDRRTVSKIFKDNRHRDVMTVHQARHVFLTWLSKKSGIENAAGQAGNRVSSMNTYLHSSEAELEADINEFE